MIEKVEKNIRQIRAMKNLSQEHLAAKLGLSIRAYSKIENGETQLTIHRLNQISEAMEVTPFEVLGFSDKQVFNDCNQSGNISCINNIPEKLIESYESQIKQLKDEVLFLRSKFSN